MQTRLALSCYFVTIITIFAAATDAAHECISDDGDTAALKKHLICLRSRVPGGDKMSIGQLGQQLQQQGDLQGAVYALREAVRRQKSSDVWWYELASAYELSGNLTAALSTYHTALATIGEHVVFLNNAATIEYSLRNWPAAELLYMRALRVIGGGEGTGIFEEEEKMKKKKKRKKKEEEEEEEEENHSRGIVMNNIGNARREQKMLVSARKAYEAARKYRIDDLTVVANLMHVVHSMCDWGYFDHLLHNIFLDRWRKAVQTGMNGNRIDDSNPIPDMQPFDAIGYDLSPEDTLLCARVAAWKSRHNIGVSLHPPPSLSLPSHTSSPLIGYVSAALGDHPTTHLLGTSLSHIRYFRQRMYALSGSDGSAYLSTLKASVGNSFVHVPDKSSKEIAELINRQNVAILIDLDGYIGSSRDEIFAYQAAPIQISFLGFHGSTGAAHIDGILTNTLTSPPDLRHHYSERLILLSYSHFVADYSRFLPILPSDGKEAPRPLMACNFGQLYKLSNESLASWIRVMMRAPESSILQLMAYPPEGEAYVRAFAESLGFPKNRLQFVTRTPKEEHLVRHRQCRIVFDTPKYNCHTTGTDALFAGSHMITLPLERMASRVAASFRPHPRLHLVRSMQEYEQIAYHLLTRNEGNESKLIEDARVHPFVAIDWTRRFETAMRMAVDGQIALQHKKFHVVVVEQTSEHG